jgi:hypothetical protein
VVFPPPSVTERDYGDTPATHRIQVLIVSNPRACNDSIKSGLRKTIQNVKKASFTSKKVLARNMSTHEDRLRTLDNGQAARISAMGTGALSISVFAAKLGLLDLGSYRRHDAPTFAATNPDVVEQWVQLGCPDVGIGIEIV